MTKHRKLSKIGKLNIPENKILKYPEVEKHFVDKLNVIKVSNNGMVDFSIIVDLIKTAETKPNIYEILTKKPNEKKWILKYIKDRLRQYLVKKHE